MFHWHYSALQRSGPSSSFRFEGLHCLSYRPKCTAVNYKVTDRKFVSTYNKFNLCCQYGDTERDQTCSKGRDCVPVCRHQNSLVECRRFYENWNYNIHLIVRCLLSVPCHVTLIQLSSLILRQIYFAQNMSEILRYFHLISDSVFP
jgi:hypothetical protein